MRQPAVSEKRKHRESKHVPIVRGREKNTRRLNFSSGSFFASLLLFLMSFMTAITKPTSSRLTTTSCQPPRDLTYPSEIEGVTKMILSKQMKYDERLSEIPQFFRGLWRATKSPSVSEKRCSPDDIKYVMTKFSWVSTVWAYSFCDDERSEPRRVGLR